MVAIVAGRELGLFNSSANVLGGLGILGQGALGQSGGRAYVNAANGNLILQFQDEQLSGRGLDLLQLRTYNSQAQWTGATADGDNDGWRWDGESIVQMWNGTIGATDSSVKRTDSAGNVTIYRWDAVLRSYVSSDGDGAHDTLVYLAKDNPADNEWLWTDGSTRRQEYYRDSTTSTMIGRLSKRVDASGNIVTFEYDGPRLRFITDVGSAQKIELTYENNKLRWVSTYQLNVDADGRILQPPTASTTPVKQVEYQYDAAGRLEHVRTDLTPWLTTDSRFYVTTYAYDGTSTRILSIRQNDGSDMGNAPPYEVRFTYQHMGNGADFVKTVSDANGTQTFTYDVANRRTDIRVTDAAGRNAQTWTYTYDNLERLTKIESPAPIGASRLTTAIAYDDTPGRVGDVKQITDPRGRSLVYEYDARGNRISERDAEGNRITRTFSATNQLLTETRYRTVVDDEVSDPLTTNYVYDDLSRVRFVVSPEGRVTEYRYDGGGYGQVTSTLQYVADRYLDGPFSVSSLAAWVAGPRPDKSKVAITQFSYDFRGNLRQRVDYASADATGVGELNAAATVTEYIYDGHGALLQTLAMRGANHTEPARLSSFGYDGMGRETTRTTADGTQTTAYDDKNNAITVTTAAGQRIVSSYDKVGHLTSVSRSDTNIAGTPVRDTKYLYDAQGRVAMTQDAQLGRQFNFYDAAGRLEFTADSAGEVCRYEYDEAGNLLTQTHYATRIATSGWLDDNTNPTRVIRTTLIVGTDVTASDADRQTHFSYDNVGRLVSRIDAANVDTQTMYDGLSRVTRRVTGDRVTEYLYDGDGLNVGIVDPLGYLTENKFDGAGRLIETVRYNTRSPLADVNLNRTGPVWIGVANQSATGGKPFSYRMQAVDKDGDAITYSLVGTVPAWLSLDTSIPGFPTLRGTPPAGATTYAVRVRASDSGTPPNASDATVQITVGNTAPHWNVPFQDAVVRVNTRLDLTFPEAIDNETASGSLVYSIVGGDAVLPRGLSFNGARGISGVPTVGGTYVITVRVADGTGSGALSTTRSFVVQVTDEAPMWSPPHALPEEIYRNVPLAFSFAGAVDPEGQALEYRLVDKPSWLTFTSSGNVITLGGVPTALGAVVIKFEAVDPSGGKATLSFVLNVANRRPEWTVPAPPATQAGSAFAFSIPAAVDTDGGTLTYSISGLPDGFTFTAPNGASAGLISGNNNTIGSFAITLRVTDAEGLSAGRAFVIVRNNAPPKYNGGLHDLGPVQLKPLSVDITIPDSMFTDGNGDALTYSLSATRNGSASSSPLSLLPGPPRRLFGAIPTTFGASHRWVFTLTVNDGRGGTASGSFGVDVIGQFFSEQPASGEQGDEIALLAPADPLAEWRPATSAADLHSYVYYDGQGRVVGAVDEQGFLSEMVYDSSANTLRSVQYFLNAVAVTASDTLSTLKNRADTGTLSKSVTVNEFDNFGRLHRAIEADGSTSTRYEYDSAGRLVREVRGGDTASEQRASRMVYNAFGELTGVVRGEGEAILTGTVTQQAIDNAIATHGTRYEYDNLGRRIKAITQDLVNGAHHDAVALFYYDSESRLTHTVNPLGEVVENVYNAFGQVESVRSYATRVPDSNENPLLTQLKSGAKGRADLVSALAGLANELDQVVRYEYDNRGQLKKTIDAEGFETVNTYDNYGQLATQTRTIDQRNAVTSTTQFDYDLRGSLLSLTSDVGGLNFNRRTVYDAFGRVTQSIDAAGKVTTTSYKDSGRAIEVTYPDAGVGTRMVRTEYDAFQRVLKAFDASGTVTTYTYDPVARSVRITTPVTSTESISVITTRTRFGEVLSVTTGLSGSDTTGGKTTRYEYNKNGQLTRVVDALGQEVVSNEYDKESGLLTSIVDGGVRTSFKYDGVGRVLEKLVDPNVGTHVGQKIKTSYEFDAFGQQIKIVEGQDSAGARTTVYKYDRNGRLSRVTVDPNGAQLVTEYRYDGDGNIVRVTQGTPSDLSQSATLYVFDKLGRRIKEIAAPTAVLGAGPASARDLTIEYRYDAAGRVSRRIAASGESTWYIYNAVGELTHTIDAEGSVSQNVYDKNGRVVSSLRYATLISTSSFGDVVDSVSPANGNDDQRSLFVYDLAGRLRFTLKNANGANWTISENIYDLKGDQLIETRSYDAFIDQARINAIQTGGIAPDEVRDELIELYKAAANKNPIDHAARTRFVYDNNGRLHFTVDALGSVTENVYDVGGRVTAIVRYATRPDLASGVLDESAVTGALNRNNANNQISRFAYDSAGRLHFTARVLASDGQGNATEVIVSEEQLDALGRVLLSTTYGTTLKGTFAATDFTVDNLADKLTPSAALDRRTAFVYDGVGRQIYSARVQSLDSEGRPLHVVTKVSYDSLGHVVETKTFYNTLRLEDYSRETLDDATEVPAVANNAFNRSTRFAYDKIGRQRFVVAADGSFSETVYDALGQVTEVRRFALPIASNTVISEEGLSNRRSMLKVGDGETRGERYTYDKLGQLRTTTDAKNFVESYTYDAFGNRSSFTDKEGKTWNYAYDRLGRLRAETKPSARIQLSNESSGVERRLTTELEYDALGNLFKRTEAAGTVDARATVYEFDRLGREVKVTQPGWYNPSSGRVEKTAANAASFQRTRETTYDELGNVVRSAVRSGPGSSEFLFEYQTYDLLGRVKHDVDALGNVTAVDYNVFGDELAVTRYSKTVGAPTAANGLWSASAVVTAIGVDNESRTVTMEYDNVGRKTVVKHPPVTYLNPQALARAVVDQREIRYDYNAFGEIVHEAVKVSAFSSTGPMWRDTWHYFDVMGQEVRTIDALGFHTARSYDKLGNLTDVTEYFISGDLGNTNAAPPALPDESSKDRITHFVYNSLDQQTSVQRFGLRYTEWDAAQGKYVDVRNGRGDAKTVLTLEYDRVGRVTAQTDGLNNITRTTYNSLGQVTGITEPARVTAGTGSLDPFVAQNMASPVTSFSLSAFGEIREQTRRAGGGSGATLTVKNEYDFGGNLVRTTDANYNAGVNIDPSNSNIGVKLRRYDYAGRVITETQDIHVSSTQLQGGADFAQTLRREYGYDALGRQRYAVDVYTTRDGVREKSGQRMDYNAFGEITDEYKVWGTASQTLDTLNRAKSASYVYDKAGQMISRRAGDGITNFYYNVDGKVIWQEQRGSDTTDPSKYRNTYTTYDVMGRATLQELPKINAFRRSRSGGLDGSLVDIARRVEQTYDRWGNVLSLTTGGWRLISDNTVDDSFRTTTIYSYNSDNQLMDETLPMALAYGEDQHVYGGRLVHGRRYDVLGRQVQEFDWTADDEVTPADEQGFVRIRTSFYNAAGQLTSYVDATGRKTEYAYDAHGRRVATRDPLGRVFVDEVDPNGNIVRHHLVRNLDGTQYNSFAPNGPLMLVTLNRYQYDQANRRVLSADFTNDPQADFKQYVTLTRYDERGLVRQIAQGMKRSVSTVLENVQTTKDYGYDQFGNKNKEVGTHEQNWSYELRDYIVGRMTDMNGEGVNAHRHYEYNEFGQVASETRDRYTATYDYHGDGMLAHVREDIRNTNGVGLTRHALRDTNYRYDSDGRQAEELLIITDLETGFWLFNQHTRTLYDALGRVTQVNGLWSGTGDNYLTNLTYQYDAVGNRLFTLANYLDNGVTPSFKGIWNTYDAEGRVLVADGEMDWRGVKQANLRTDITYDAAGRRQTAVTHSQTDLKNFTATENYSYDDLDYLTGMDRVTLGIPRAAGLLDEEDPNPVTLEHIREVRVFDTTGHMKSNTEELDLGGHWSLIRRTTSTYDAWGNLGTQKIESGGRIADITYNSDARGVLRDYLTILTDPRIEKPEDREVSRTQYVYRYATLSGEYEEESIGVTLTTRDGSTLSGTANIFDGKGNLAEQSIGLGNRGFSLPDYFYDAKGNIVSKIEHVTGSDARDGVRNYFYSNGMEVAAIGSGSMQGVELISSFTPISDSYPSSVPGRYIVGNNDTLASIARTVFGDASLWYLIADTNQLAFGPSERLPDGEIGKSYIIPNVVNGFRNSADTFKPFHPGDVIGNSTPTAPIPQPPDVCIDTGKLLVAIAVVAVAAVVTVVTKGLAAQYVGGYAAAAIGAAAGSAAAQSTEILLTDKKWGDFSGKQVLFDAAKAAATAGITAGLNGVDGASKGLLDRLVLRGMSTAAAFTIDTIRNGGGGDDDISWASLGVQMAASAVLPEFPGGSMIDSIVGSSFDARTGWVFNEKNRNWTNVLIQAGGALTRVGVTAGVGYLAQQLRLFGSPAQNRQQQGRGKRTQIADIDGGTVRKSYDPSSPNGKREMEPELVDASGTDINRLPLDPGKTSDIERTFVIYEIGTASIDKTGAITVVEPGEPPDLKSVVQSAPASSGPDYWAAFGKVLGDGVKMPLPDLLPPSMLLVDEPPPSPVSYDPATQISEMEPIRTEASPHVIDNWEQSQFEDAVWGDGRAQNAIDERRQLSNDWKAELDSRTIVIRQPEYEVDRDRVASWELGTYNDRADQVGALLEIATKANEASVAQGLSQYRYKFALRWPELKDLHVPDLMEKGPLFKALSKLGNLPGLSRALKLVGPPLGKLADRVGFVTDFADRALGNASDAQTGVGKVLDGFGAAYLGNFLGGKAPILMGLDASQAFIMNKLGLADSHFGEKPIPLQDTFKGGWGNSVALGESFVTGQFAGLESAVNRALSGERGWVMRDMFAVGVYAREHGGGDRAFMVGEGWKEIGVPGFFQRLAAFGASIPGLGHLGEGMGVSAAKITFDAGYDQTRLWYNTGMQP